MLEKGFADAQVKEFISQVNGMGDCGQVNVYVADLAKAKSKTIRGVVDWDKSNKKRAEGVTIAAKGYAYSLENILLDPLCVLQMVRIKDPEKYSIVQICGDESISEAWLDESGLAQAAIDRYVFKVLGRVSAGNAQIHYLDGRVFKIDKEYLEQNGKLIQGLVLKAYPELRSYAAKENLLSSVARHMSAFGSKNIPSVFGETFAAIQK